MVKPRPPLVYRDAVVVKTRFAFPLLERLRLAFHLLLGYELGIRVEVETEQVAGRVRTKSVSVWDWHPWARLQKSAGFGQAETPTDDPKDRGRKDP